MPNTSLSHTSTWSKDSESFARDLIHDLMNPLTSLNLILETNFHYKDGAGNAVEDAKDRIRCLTNTLSILLGKKTENIVMSTRSELQYITDSLEARARRYNVSFIFMHEVDAILLIEPITFYRIFLNLLSNAIDSYQASTLKAKKVIIRSRKLRGYVEIIVEDFGCGLEKSLETLSKDSMTTKYEGTGHGLRIVERYVSQAGAQMKVRNKRDGGVLVSVIFPVDD